MLPPSLIHHFYGYQLGLSLTTHFLCNLNLNFKQHMSDCTSSFFPFHFFKNPNSNIRLADLGFTIYYCYLLCTFPSITFLFLNQFISMLHHHPEKAMAPHSSTLPWKITWMEEPGRLQSMGSHKESDMTEVT